jgi:alkylhydroperoxidase family enzyme
VLAAVAMKGRRLSEPRIPPRPSDDWDAEVLDALSALRSPRSGSRPAGPRRERPVSNILGIFSWHPALAKAFFAFNSHLFHSTLPARDREMATVRIAWLRRGEYEWAQHVRMAKTAGLSDEEVGAIMAGPDSPVWGPRDAALLRAVGEIAADHYVSDDTWKRLSEDFDRKQLMDLVFTIGAYDLLAMAFNTFGLQLDPELTGFPPDNPANPANQE